MQPALVEVQSPHVSLVMHFLVNKVKAHHMWKFPNLVHDKLRKDEYTSLDVKQKIEMGPGILDMVGQIYFSGVMFDVIASWQCFAAKLMNTLTNVFQ